MHTTWGVVKISGSLLPSLRNLHEGTTRTGLVSLVALDLLFRRRNDAAAVEKFIILPMLDTDFIDHAMVLSTGIQKTGNTIAHATEGGSHCRHLTSSHRYSSNRGSRKAPCFPLRLYSDCLIKSIRLSKGSNYAYTGDGYQVLSICTCFLAKRSWVPREMLTVSQSPLGSLATLKAWPPTVVTCLERLVVSAWRRAKPSACPRPHGSPQPHPLPGPPRPRPRPPPPHPRP